MSEPIKIEGIPDGWELVRIGTPMEGEWVIALNTGEPYEMSYDSLRYQPIIRKIEPPKRYRAFANAAEFTPYREEWIQAGDGDGCWKVSGYSNTRIFIDAHQSESFANAFERYTFSDGTPFGIEVTE